jgi:hypothetical protein
MDSEQKPPDAFMTALVTEHFVLQGARGTLTAESASRAALYLASLTGSLIALGFVARDAAVLGPFAAAVLPALLVLGEFTYWRLVRAGVEDLHHSWEMRRIRAYYRQLVPPGLPFFADARLRDPTAPGKQFMGVRVRDLNVLLTASSMVAAINSMLAGAAVALAGHAIVNLSAGWAVGLASLIAAVLYLVHTRVAIREYNIGLADLRVPPLVTE